MFMHWVLQMCLNTAIVITQGCSEDIEIEILELSTTELVFSS